MTKEEWKANNPIGKIMRFNNLVIFKNFNIGLYDKDNKFITMRAGATNYQEALIEAHELAYKYKDLIKIM